jgi:hypothetical protein
VGQPPGNLCHLPIKNTNAPNPPTGLCYVLRNPKSQNFSKYFALEPNRLVISRTLVMFSWPPVFRLALRLYLYPQMNVGLDTPPVLRPYLD